MEPVVQPETELMRFEQYARKMQACVIELCSGYLADRKIKRHVIDGMRRQVGRVCEVQDILKGKENATKEKRACNICRRPECDNPNGKH